MEVKHALSVDVFNSFPFVAVGIVVATAAFNAVIVSRKLGGCVGCAIFGFISNKLLTSFGSSQPCFGFISIANVSEQNIFLLLLQLLSAPLPLPPLLLLQCDIFVAVATVAGWLLHFFRCF